MIKQIIFKYSSKLIKTSKRKLLFIIVFLFLFYKGNAQEEKNKAIIIYKLASQISWPASVSPFIIGIYGDTKIKNVLDIIARSKKLHGREIKVVKITNPAEIDNCQILFVPKENYTKISTLNEYVAQKYILLMSESLGAIKKGVEINLVQVEGKTIFEISKANIQTQNLVATDQLYALAYKVY